MATRATVTERSIRRTVSAIHEHRFGLTTRELDVVAFILRGYRNKRIASQLSIAENTVKYHLSRVFKKIGVSGRVQLAAFAINHQLIPLAGTAWNPARLEVGGFSTDRRGPLLLEWAATSVH